MARDVHIGIWDDWHSNTRTSAGKYGVFTVML
jgi:hypothetical protein